MKRFFVFLSLLPFLVYGQDSWVDGVDTSSPKWSRNLATNPVVGKGLGTDGTNNVWQLFGSSSAITTNAADARYAVKASNNTYSAGTTQDMPAAVIGTLYATFIYGTNLYVTNVWVINVMSNLYVQMDGLIGQNLVVSNNLSVMGIISGAVFQAGFITTNAADQRYSIKASNNTYSAGTTQEMPTAKVDLFILGTNTVVSNWPSSGTFNHAELTNVNGAVDVQHLTAAEKGVATNPVSLADVARLSSNNTYNAGTTQGMAAASLSGNMTVGSSSWIGESSQKGIVWSSTTMNFTHSSATNRAILFSTDGGTERMRLRTDNGNLGIATVTPGERLDVNGNINVQTNVYANGSIGIGTNIPSAYLHIKAGTATASNAPLKFTSGTLNTTPEAGAIEFDGTHFYISK